MTKKEEVNDAVPIRGIVNVSGPIGSGKSSVAYECGVRPERMIVLDWDGKRPNITGLKKYVAFMDEQWLGTELDMSITAQKVLGGIKEGEYDLLILDGWEKFVATLGSYCQKNSSKLKAYWSGAGTWKQQQVNGYAKVYEDAILAGIQKKVPLIIIINHLSYMYVNNTRTTKQIPNARKAVKERSNLRLFLQTNERYSHPCPSALVLKNLSSPKWNEEKGRLEMRNVFPKRLDVRCVPNHEQMDYVSVWDMINYYSKNPMLAREPAEWEVPDEEENTIILNTLTADQQAAVTHQRRIELITTDTAMTDDIRDLAAEGKTSLFIAKELKEKHPNISPAIVKAILDAGG